MPRSKDNPAKPHEPRADRPEFPKVYSISKSKAGMMPWREVVRKLERSRNYWIATTRPDGRPHVMPVWGMWVEGAVYFGTHGGSRKARNIAANPATVVHLESGDDVVILEGTAHEVPRTDSALLQKLDRACQKKYKMKLMFPPGSVLYSLRPRKAFAWRERDFPKSATRWKFQD